MDKHSCRNAHTTVCRTGTSWSVSSSSASEGGVSIAISDDIATEVLMQLSSDTTEGLKVLTKPGSGEAQA